MTIVINFQSDDVKEWNLFARDKWHNVDVIIGRNEQVPNSSAV